MKNYLLLLLVILFVSITISRASDFVGGDDGEFAEFEEFETEEGLPPSKAEWAKDADTPHINKISDNGHNEFEENEEDDEGVVEDEDSEFEHFQDEEEFEGYGSSKPSVQTPPNTPKTEPKITITNVPHHLRAHWDSYWLEMLMIAGLSVYFINFFSGRSKNTKLANLWLNTHKSLLDENFALVGDDGKLETDSPGLMKESDNHFTLWCSGRSCCEGMLVELKLIKRQDLVAIISGLLRPVTDQVHIKVELSKDDMDNFIFCVGNKKSALHMSKEMADLSVYCPERRPGDKIGLPQGFMVMSELQEATSAILDSRVIAAFNKYGHMIESLHISDQFSGVKQPEDPSLLKQPDVSRILHLVINLNTKTGLQEACDQAQPLLVLVFYLMEKIKRYRLSKEGKSKSEKNRLRVEEAFLKSTHAARAEAAAQRREDRRKQEKERVMAEDDPEKQRRWEEKEQKRQLKKKAPKMKQLKVKAL